MDAGTLAMVGGILALLLFSAVFSGTETAFTAASRAFVSRRAREGDARAQTLERLRRQKDRLLAAILVGNNLVNTTATALASSLLIAWFGEGGVVYASLAMTALLVVFSEVLPKTYALQHPDASALRAAPLLRVTARAFGPPAAAVNWVVRRTLRLLGVRPPAAESAGITEEELLGAIELHGADERGEAEAAAQEERRMLRGVLALDDLTVGDVMTHRGRIRGVDADAPPSEQLRELLDIPYTRVPLWRQGGAEVLGMLDARAALRALHAAGGDSRALDLRTVALPVAYVPEIRPLRELLAEFRRSHQQVALVVDEYGGLQGLVTLEDIVEVVVGQIAERGEAILADTAAGDGTVEVRADTRLRDLNRELDWNLPEDEAATIGGLVARRLHAIPSVGEEVVVGDYTLRVLERRGWRVDRLAIQRRPQPAPAEQ